MSEVEENSYRIISEIQKSGEFDRLVDLLKGKCVLSDPGEDLIKSLCDSGYDSVKDDLARNKARLPAFTYKRKVRSELRKTVEKLIVAEIENGSVANIVDEIVDEERESVEKVILDELIRIIYNGVVGALFYENALNIVY